MNNSIFKIKSSIEAKNDQKTENIPSDVSGSYTGVPLNETKPTQDVDDL